MTISVMQPYLFPYIGYWQLIAAADIFVLYDDVHFIKKGYIHRNSILINGQEYKFTLEVLKNSQNKLINELERGENASKILKSIEIAYKKAPYYQNVYSLLEEILGNNEKNLAKYIKFSIEKISQYLEINTIFIDSSSIKKNNLLKKEDKIIDILKHLKATNYINAIGGQKLYNKERFRSENINLKFLQTELLPYPQFVDSFIPNLSIIDILMFNNKKDIKTMLSKFQLI